MAIAHEVNPASARLSTLRLVAVCAAVAGVVMGITVWWVSGPVINQVSSYPDPYVNSGAFAVQHQLTISTPFRADMPDASSAPSGDLLAAIKRAQAATGNSTLSPAGQSSWQGMSDKAAAKVFEDAVKAAQQRSSAVIVSPFGAVKN